MKTLKKGKLPKPWIGKTGECTNCHCVVRMEKGDPSPKTQGSHYVLKCPTKGCSKTILIPTPEHK